MVRISNPGPDLVRPSWFSGAELQLKFGDVFSIKDAKQFNTSPPTMEDLRSAIDFFLKARNDPSFVVLFHCDQGASRSPAVALVCLAAVLGEGKESKAFEEVLSVRPEAIPNQYVVRLGDDLLSRNGGLVHALAEHIDPEFNDFFNDIFSDD